MLVPLRRPGAKTALFGLLGVLAAAALAIAFLSMRHLDGDAPDPGARSDVGAGDAAPAATGLYDDFGSYAAGNWAGASTHGPWQVAFDGFGTVRVTARGELSLAPEAATQPDETHAALVTSRREFRGGIEVSLAARTIEQLRSEAPNPWETGWVVWNFTDTDHFYYFLLKTNGWELGKRDPAYPGNQRFLATGAAPAVQLGAQQRIRIRHSDAAIEVWVDTARLARFVDAENPYDHGSVGLYTEDARVEFDDVRVSALGS